MNQGGEFPVRNRVSHLLQGLWSELSMVAFRSLDLFRSNARKWPSVAGIARSNAPVLPPSLGHSSDVETEHPHFVTFPLCGLSTFDITSDRQALLALLLKSSEDRFERADANIRLCSSNG